MIRSSALRRLPVVLLLLLWSLPAAGETVGTVTRVYDGDTLVVAGVGTVRLLGIDSPEKEDSERDRYYLRRGIALETLRRTARQALAFNRRHALGKAVTMTFDHERTDRHGRTLAYLTLPDGRMLNMLLLKKGLAAVYRRFDFHWKDAFLAAESEARQAGQGMWSHRAPSARPESSSRDGSGGWPLALRSGFRAQ